MTGGAGAAIFRSSGEAGVGRVTDFNLAEGDRVVLISARNTRQRRSAPIRSSA